MAAKQSGANSTGRAFGGGTNSAGGGGGGKGTAGGNKLGGLAQTSQKASPQAQVNRQFGSREKQIERARTSAASSNAASGGQPFGGTAVTQDYEPGAVENRPDANPLVEGGKAVAIGPMGGAVTALTQALGISSGDPFGGTQDGWSRDRSKGAGSFNPNDARGLSATEEQEIVEREIQGQRFGAGTEALTGDIPETPEEASDEFSDVTLRDRRKPRVLGAGTQLLAGL